MTLFISIIFVLLFTMLIVYALYSDTQNKVWEELALTYPSSNDLCSNSKYKIQMVFFRKECEKKFDYFNSMKVLMDEKGISMKPTLNHYFLKPIFIPLKNVKLVKEKYLFIKKRKVFKVDGHDICIAI